MSSKHLKGGSRDKCLDRYGVRNLHRSVRWSLLELCATPLPCAQAKSVLDEKYSIQNVNQKRKDREQRSLQVCCWKHIQFGLKMTHIARWYPSVAPASINLTDNCQCATQTIHEPATHCSFKFAGLAQAHPQEYSRLLHAFTVQAVIVVRESAVKHLISIQTSEKRIWELWFTDTFDSIMIPGNLGICKI